VSEYFSFLMSFYANLEPMRAANGASEVDAVEDAARAVAGGFFSDDPPLSALDPDDGRNLVRDVISGFGVPF
jgi:hypothetical protein